jgi:glycerate dehydrogenase
MLTLSTNLLAYMADVRAGRWQESDVFCLLDHPITELSGKTLGIVGHGELGKGVADVARAFGMKVTVAARPGTTATGDRIPLEELLSEVDYLSLHCPLTDDNRHIINERALQLMKPTAFLINTARGGLVDSNALIAALKADTIAGAAVDVLDVEPPLDDETLLRTLLPNLIVTPHNAWGARESRTRLVEQMRENIEAFLAGAPLRALT